MPASERTGAAEANPFRKNGKALVSKVTATESLKESILHSIDLIGGFQTHKWAKLTMSLKLSVGFMRPRERGRLHVSKLQEKVADLNLVVNPSLISMDGRKCFISG